MDLKKVFIEKEHVSPELLAKVERARLKVEVCEECRCLSDRFSEVCRQLEKLEIELESTLRLIHGKLKGADVSDKLRGLTTGLNSNRNGLLEILDVLRAEAIRKSAHKLAHPPRVKVQNLARKEITAKQAKLQNKSRLNQESPQFASSTVFAPDGVIEMSGFKMESHDDQCLSDNGDYFSGGVHCNQDEGPIVDDAETRAVKLEHDINADEDIVTDEEEVIVNRKSLSRIPRNVIIGKSSINSETGKRKCEVCYLEYNNYDTFKSHYRAVHLKLRYKCICCKKMFTDKSNFRRHQQTVRSCMVTGTAPAYSCHLCERKFAHKHHLQDHLDGIHYKLLNYECNICKKKFNVKRSVAAHQRRLHGLGKTND